MELDNADTYSLIKLFSLEIKVILLGEREVIRTGKKNKTGISSLPLDDTSHTSLQWQLL